jgi:glycosyltransferase involved in cell wall biosynthesis
MKYNFIDTSKPKTVTIITPTIGSPKLQDALVGVQNQTYKHIQHLVVIDGPEYVSDVSKHIYRNTKTTIAPENTGANGYNGQRIYASYPHLVNSDYIAFLDEDNWYDTNHIEILVKKIEEQNLDWAYSLRKIYSDDKKFLIEDNCESLGKWPICFSQEDNPQYLIDTSCFLFKREFITKTCHLWHTGPWGEDRRFLEYIRNRSKWNTTGQYTLCYRLDGNPKSVTQDFFVTGNEIMKVKYNDNYPWKVK